MLFSSRPAIILVLKRDALLAYTSKDEQAKLDFPPSVVRNLEIVDPIKFGELISGFVQRYGFKGRKFVLALDDSVVFQKVVPASEPAAAEAAFKEAVPLEAEAQRLLSVKVKDQIVLLVANGGFYEPLVRYLSSIGVKIIAVVPLSIFSKGESRLTPDLVQRITRSRRLVELADFATPEHAKK